MRLPDPVDESLVDALRRLPQVSALEDAAAEQLFERADHHGVAVVLQDAWSASGTRPPASLALRNIARELDYDAQLALLDRLDAAFAHARIRVVVLKGVFLGLRVYPRGAARRSTDIDLLVRTVDLDRCAKVLEGLGYRCADSEAKQAWSRAQHHHDLYVHEALLPVELHFLAYRGFGAELRSEPLLERSEAVPGFAALRALERADEIAYLCIHAAAHRFGRIGWLYDLALLIEKSERSDVERAAERARTWGFGRAVAFAGVLLGELLAVPDADALGSLGFIRSGVLRAIVGEPKEPLVRAATRLAYGTMLADSASRALVHARRSIGQRIRGALGLEP